MEWKPIETAPKDGTPLLLWATAAGWERTGYCRVAAFWDGTRWALYGPAGHEPKATGDYKDNWTAQSLSSAHPSHWMPLPNPPSDAQ